MSAPVAFVTGAGRGVGRAIAIRLARDGYAIAAVGPTVDTLEETVGFIRSSGSTGAAVRCDVVHRDQVDDVVERVEQTLGPIRALINNAGIAGSAPFASMTDALWDRVIAVNLTGTYNCMRRIIPGMFHRRDGRIVNIASTAAKVGYPYTAAYVASKHGVLGLTRAVALEAQRYGVTVNAICPGWIDTDMTRESIGRIAERTGRSLEDARETLAGMNSSGRLIDPATVADLCAHLLSPAAASTTGEALDIT